MKNNTSFVLLSSMVILSTLLSACGGGLTEPKADQPVDPFLVWPVVFDATTQQYYHRVMVPTGASQYIPGAMPSIWYGHALLPIEPMSAEETAANLTEFGIDPNGPIGVIIMPSNYLGEDGYERNLDGLVMAGAAIAKVNPITCSAIIGHLAFRVAEGVAWSASVGAITALANGQIQPDAIRVGSDSTAIQFYFEGMKWLAIFRDSAPPTLIAPVMGNTLGRMVGSLKPLTVLDGPKATSIMAEVGYFFRCVIQKWPKTPGDVDQIRKDHNETYSAKRLDAMPADFPVPFPGSDEPGDVQITVYAGDFSKMESASFKVLALMGLVVLVVDGIPGDEVVGGAAYLQWSASLVYAVP